MSMSQSKELFLLWDEGKLLIMNSTKALEKEILTIIVKSLVPDEKKPWEKITKKVKRQLFEIKQEKPFRVVQTDQGFCQKVTIWAYQNGYKVKVKDNRKEFPEPNLKLIRGTRFSQAELLSSALLQNRSGLIGAPTRYGKSVLIENTCRTFPSLQTVVTAPGVDLINELYEKISTKLPDRDVVKIGGSSRTQFSSHDITVCSMDSLYKCNFSKTKLLLIDEPHASVTETRAPIIAQFDLARKYGYGATLKGRYDGKDAMIEGLIGPVLVERTYKQAVEEGAICPIECIMVKLPYKGEKAFNRDAAYNKYLFKSERIAATVGWMLKELIPKDWQTLGFIKNEKQAEFFLPYLGKNGVIAMAKRMNKVEREDIFGAMASGALTRCLASDIYAQGVTFSDLKCVLNLGGGGPYTNSIQKPGRLAEIRPGKRCGVMIDFIFEFDESSYANQYNCLARDSKNRYEVYKEKGYGIHWVSTREEMVEVFNKFCI